MDNELKIRIVGDATSLEAASNDAQKTLSTLSSKIQKLENDILSNIKITQGYENAIENLTNELKTGKITQDQFTKSLNRLKRDEKETAIATANLRKQLVSLKTDQRNVTNAISNGGGAQRGLKKDIRGTMPTMLEFNRVIQDAPFGIIGVGNNIQQLTANFSILKRNAGGTKAAMQALISSFAGPAGLLFAVSAVTSLLTVFGDKLFNSSNKLDDLKKKVEGINESFDAEIDLSEKIEKTLELQGLSLDNILISRKGILNQQAQSVGLVLAENAALLNRIKTQNEEVTNLEIILSIFRKIGGMALTIAGTLFDENKVVTGLVEKYAKILGFEIDRSKFSGATKKEKEEQKKLEDENLRLQAQIQGVVADILLTEKQITEEREKNKPKDQTATIRQQIDQVGLVDQGAGLTELPPVKITADTSGLKEIDPDIDRLNQKLANTLIFADAFNAGISSSFSTLSQQVSNSLSTGVAVLDSFVAAFLDSLAQVAAAMVQQAILDKLFSAQKFGSNLAQSNANAITIATNAAAALGPAGALALPGLIASQLALVNSAFAAIPKFNDGGVIGGGRSVGDQILIRANSGERILTNSDQDFLSRFLRGNVRNGFNNENITVTGVLRGSDILLSNKRSDRNNRRFGA